MTDGNGRRRGADILSDEEVDSRVSAEIARALGIANMLEDRLVAEVHGRMATAELHAAGVSRARVRQIVRGMVADGTVEEFDAAHAEAVGVGCPCCAGGQDVSGAAGVGARTAVPVLRAADAGLGQPVSHAAYCLLDTWEADHGTMIPPTDKQFQKELCRRGKYDRDAVVDAVQLLQEWGVFDVSGGAITINGAAWGRLRA